MGILALAGADHAYGAGAVSQMQKERKGPLGLIHHRLAQRAENKLLREAEARKDELVKELADGLWEAYLRGDISEDNANQKLVDYRNHGVSHGDLTDRIYHRMLRWIAKGY